MALITLAALTMVSCQHDSGDNDSGGRAFEPLPAGVHVAGFEVPRPGKWLPVYWTGSRRVSLEIPPWTTGAATFYFSPKTVSIAYTVAGNGVVWITGTFDYTDSNGIVHRGYCYWINGTYYEFPDYAVFTAHDGAVYAAGRTADPPYYIGVWRYENGVREEIGRMDGTSAYPHTIAVGADGTVYVVGGTNVDGVYKYKCWYLSGGAFAEYHEYDYDQMDYPVLLENMKVTGGRIIAYFIKPQAAAPYIEWSDYWIDDLQFPIERPDDSYINDVAVSGDTVYMAGHCRDGACYWIDGERHDLDGFAATAIFVAE